MKDPRLSKLAEVLVNYSAKIKPGEKVFIMCNDVSIPWAKEVAKAAINAGGMVETIINNEEISEVILQYGSDEQLKHESLIMETMVKNANVMLSAFGTKNTRINANIDPEKIRLSTLSQKSWREIFHKRMADGELRWCGTLFPTHSLAQEADMSLNDYEDFVYGAGLLETKNPAEEWQKVHNYQEKWVKYLDTKKELHFISEGTDIKLSVNGRKWINCDGQINFPDGEIFTSPVEDSINGHITFTFPAIYQGKEVEGVKLEVENGKVVKATAEKGEALLKSILETDEGASFFGEVAIGTNRNIQKFTRNILFDEKIGGTIHMAIGKSIGGTGGTNDSVIHWDMICNMRNGGKIFADGELFYENGEFKEEVL